MIKLFKLCEEVDEARNYWLERLEAREFLASDGTKLPYRLYVPDGYQKEQKYPLQIHLHGAGIRGNDNCFQIYHDVKQTQMLFAYQHYEPFIFAIPQCPLEYMWSALNHEVANGLNKIRLDQTEAGPITRAVHELALYLAEEYSVDKNRIYASGASMGGAGVYEQLYRYKEMYAGAIIGCALSDSYTAATIADVPMYIMHGDSDPTISVQNSRNMVEALSKVAGNFAYREFPGRVHDFTAVSTGEAELGDAMRWMFSKRKDNLVQECKQK